MMKSKTTILVILVFILCVAGGLVLSKTRAPVEEVATEMVKLYYYNSKLDPSAECGLKGLQPVYRFLPRSTHLVEDTLQLLLRGEITELEKSNGVETEYPLEGFALIETELKEGMLTLTFDDPKGKSSGGSCRASVLWAQVEATAQQFPEVTEVRFLPEDIFQP